MTDRVRIAEAIKDPAWQEFRLSMKGKTTDEKLSMLEEYYNEAIDDFCTTPDCTTCEDVEIRIDNYIKALCRGGQLDPGMTFDHFNDGCIRNHVRK
jgi:hypothetical protein